MALSGAFLFFVFYHGPSSSSAQNPVKDHLFFAPSKIKVDAKNNLIYVLNAAGVTVLDAKDYSLVKKLFIGARLTDFYIDEFSGRKYAVGSLLSGGSPGRLIISKLRNKEEIIKGAPPAAREDAAVLDVGWQPTDIFVNSEKKIAYVFSSGDQAITVFDIAANEIKKTVKIGTPGGPENVQPFYSTRQDKFYFLENQSGKLWVLNSGENKVSAIDGAVGLFYLAINDNANELYASDFQKGSLLTVNTLSNKISSDISLEKAPSRVFYDQSLNKILILSWQTDDLTVIDPDSKKIEAAVDLGVGADPTYIVFNPQLKQLFVMNGGANTFSIIDTASWKIIETIETPPNPSAVPALNPANGDIILPIPWQHINALFIIQPDYKTKLIPEGGDSLVKESDFFAFPMFLAVHPEKGHIYVLSNIGGENGNSKVTAIDGKTEKILWMTSTGKNSREIVIDSLQNKLYVNNADENTISVINALDGKLLGSIQVGVKPRVLAIDEMAGKVFVANSRSNSISVINTALDKVESTIALEKPEPHILFYDPSNQLLYVFSADKSFLAINKDGQVIHDLKIPLEGGFPASPHFIQASSDFSKVYLLTSGGGVYQAEKDALKIIQSSQAGSRWVDAVADSQTGKIYIADIGKKAIYVLDSQNGKFQEFVKLDSLPIRLVFADSKLFIFNQGGSLDIINSRNGVNENSISLTANVGDSVFALNSPAYAIFNPVNERIYIAYSQYNALAIFDIAQNKLTGTLENETVQTIKPVPINKWIILATGFSFLVLIGFIVWQRKKRIKLAV